MTEEATQDAIEIPAEETPVDQSVDTGTEAAVETPAAEVESNEVLHASPAENAPVPVTPPATSAPPVYEPPADQAEIEQEIDKLDVLDTDQVKSVLRRTMSFAANARQRAAMAEQQSAEASIVAQREKSFSIAAKTYGVTKLEAEKLYDQRVAALQKQGFSGNDLVMRATAQWEYALEQRKDQPAPARKAATPATPVTRGGASALPRGGTAPPPPAPAKPIADKVRSGDYGALENL